MLSSLDLNSLIDWIGSCGMLLILRYLRGQDPKSPLTRNSRILFADLFVAFLLRGVLWSWPSERLDLIAYLPAATLPAAELLWVEGLLKRRFPSWIRVGAIAGSALFCLLDITGYRQGSGLVENGFGVFALGILIFCAFSLLFRDRVRLSVLENRFVDAICMASVVAIPFAATDFLAAPPLGLRMGGIAAMQLIFVLARVAGRPDLLRRLLWDLGAMAGNVTLITLGLAVATGINDPLVLGRVAVLVTGFLLLLTTLAQFRILAARRRDDSFLAWVRRLQTDDLDRFVAALEDSPMTSDCQLLRLETLEGFDRSALKAGFEARDGVLDLEDLDGECARLLRSRNMSHVFRIHRERGLYLLFRGVAVGGDQYQRKKLDLVQSMAASFEAHDLVKRRDEALRQAQKMEALGRLAGGVSHEFGNLLLVIRGFAQGMAKRLGPQAPGAEDTAEILQAAERGSALTRQLLAFSRQQQLKRERLDLAELLRNSRKMLASLLPPQHRLVLEVPDVPVPVLADEAQLEQVVLNLVINARDAMATGGEIRIRLAAGDSGAVLEFSDSGHGMDEATRARIFEPFFTTKPKGQGTGLGLPTVHGIVEQSGGEIRVKSRPGMGTTFEIRLPLSAQETVQGGQG